MNFLIILVIFLTAPVSYGQKVIHVSQSFMENTKKGIDYLIDNFFSFNSLEKPFYKPELRLKLYKWNPQVEDWTDLGQGLSVYYRRRSPVFTVRAGYLAQSFKDKISGTAHQKTKTRGPSLGLEMLNVIELQWEFRSSFTVSTPGQRTIRGVDYELPETFQWKLLGGYHPPTWRIVPLLGLEWEQISYVGLRDKSASTIANQYSGLTAHRFSGIWLTIGNEWIVEIWKRGSYFQVLFSIPLSYHRTTLDTNVSHGVSGYKLAGQWRQYMPHDWWLEYRPQLLLLDSNLETRVQEHLFTVGKNF